jgi:hypothetical protein
LDMILERYLDDEKMIEIEKEAKTCSE